MDPILLVKDERAQKNFQRKHAYETLDTKIRFVKNPPPYHPPPFENKRSD